MEGLSLDPDYIERLALKVRAIMAREETDIPDLGGNSTDDEIPATLQELPDDLLREEITEEIQGLAPDAQSELVALMWLGRDGHEEGNWQELVRKAGERKEIPTEQYLLGNSLLAEYWTEGLERLADET